jgi:hypothetical protein
MTNISDRPAPGWGVAGLVSAIAVGAFLRLLWLEDIEYKADEDFTMYLTMEAGQSEPVPAVGMHSSVGIPNFGLSIWLFIALGRLFAVRTPPDLSRAVALCSILALVLYPWFIRKLVPEREREAWYWGVVLMALNPLSLLLQRKIWPQSLLPLLTMAVLAGWLRRHRPIGAFVFGVFGALLGQLHMSGFFLAAAFVGWALLFDRHSLRWRWWLLGSIVGTLPMLPWLLHMMEHPELLATQGEGSWLNPLRGAFFLRWLVQPFGLDVLNNSLEKDFWDFLRYPLIQDQPTYFVGALHVLLAILFVVIAVPCWRRWWRLRRDWRALLVGRSSVTSFTLAASCWGLGILFALTRRPWQFFYLIVTMPLMFVGAARAALNLDDSADRPLLAPRSSLLLLCVAQGLVSLAFLYYIHVNQRPIRGDYGTPYRAQAAHKEIGEIYK